MSFRFFVVISLFLVALLFVGHAIYVWQAESTEFGAGERIALFLGIPGLIISGAGLIANFVALERTREAPENPVIPITWESFGRDIKVSDLLNWRTRLTADLVGRDDEKSELLNWAENGGGVEILFLSGPGGVGKTRLAAEIADKLASKGWNAGMARPDVAHLLTKAKLEKLFLVVDYPEDDLDRTRRLLERLTDYAKVPGPVRVLFVSRYTEARWKEETKAIASKLIAISPKRTHMVLTLPKLSSGEAVDLFERVAGGCARAISEPVPQVPVEAVRDWIETTNRDLFLLPLFVTAAAVEFALDKEHKVGLTAAEVMAALVDRERRRMDEFGHLGPLTSRLVALATVRGGLDPETLRTLQGEPPRGLGAPTQDVIDWVEKLDWWDPDKAELAGLQPDPLGAALVFEVLRERPYDAPEWLWGALRMVPAGRRSEWLAAAERIDFDIRRIYGDSEGRFAKWLALMVAGKLERAQTLGYVTQDVRTTGTRELSIDVARVLLQDPDLKDANRGVILNLLSVDLFDIGRPEEALAAAEEAVGIHQRLAEGNPTRYGLGLALSLTGWSNRLSDVGRHADALAATEDALRIYRSLAEETPAEYQAGLATILANYSNRLSDHGKAVEALAATEEALEINRRLAQQLPEKYEASVAWCLATYSIRLAARGKALEALSSIEEAVGVYKRLARLTPERHEPDLGWALTNYSMRLSDVGRATEALAVIEEALRMYRGLAKQTPERYEPDLATILTSYSNRLSICGKSREALAAAQEGLELYRRLVARTPDRYEPELATILANYSSHLSDQGRVAEASAAIKEAVEIRRALATRMPERYAPNLATSLCVLGQRKEADGNIAEAVKCFEEAVGLFREHRERVPGLVEQHLAQAEVDEQRLRRLLEHGG